MFSEWGDLKMLTARIEKIRQNYVNAKPQISCERAALWTESYKRSAGKPVCIRYNGPLVKTTLEEIIVNTF